MCTVYVYIWIVCITEHKRENENSLSEHVKCLNESHSFCLWLRLIHRPIQIRLFTMWMCVFARAHIYVFIAICVYSHQDAEIVAKREKWTQLILLAAAQTHIQPFEYSIPFVTSFQVSSMHHIIRCFRSFGTFLQP